MEDDNWKVILRFLPDNWEQQAQTLGAIKRKREIPSAEVLLRLLLIHLADGCSLRETAVRACQSGLAKVTDVALLKRLRASSQWLQWLAVNLLDRLGGQIKKPDWLERYNVRIVDASVITEPGSTGSNWRLHYSLQLFGLNCDYLNVTGQEIGESFAGFPVTKGDLLIGDRGYGTKSGIHSVLERGANFIVRVRNKAMILKDRDGTVFNLLDHFRPLEIGQVGDWTVFYTMNGKQVPIRLIAIKKSPEATAYAIKQVKREMIKKQKLLNEETLELHGYFFVLTSLSKAILFAERILFLYRMRWQVELAFKRLKSIMGLGHLPKTDPVSARAWLHGKLVVAMLVQMIESEGRSFSPWGYPFSRI
jgi:Transposase DDE domain